MKNSWQVTHGGIVMTLLDVTMAMAGRPEESLEELKAAMAQTESAPIGNVTVEMKTSFIRPANSEHGPLKAVGICLRRASSLSFCEAELFDGRGDLVAKSSGTFKFWRSR
jgi:acyl-CoA thioesterase